MHFTNLAIAGYEKLYGESYCLTGSPQNNSFTNQHPVPYYILHLFYLMTLGS